ncbi:MAG: hypothetical protein ACKUBY_03105 [Candidatus Moraniibacteriota bacterium]|jgi:flagellar biosynthesis protein FliP
MNKITYWLRKVGMLRTSSYKVSGDADKLNKIQANDGGMIQSPKEIDEMYKESNVGQEKPQQKNDTASQNNDNQNNEDPKSKILFWIFLVVGVILSCMVLLMDFSIWFVVTAVLWAWFLRNIWIKTVANSLIVGKTILVGVILIFTSFVFMGVAVSGSEETENDVVVKSEKTQETEKAKAEEKNDVVKKEVKQDKISQFMMDLKKETNINFGEIAGDKNVLWTSTSMALVPTDAKTMIVNDVSDKKWSKMKSYFKDRKGHHGTIGFEFVDKSDNKQDGYLFDDGDYRHLMCILTKAEKTMSISCGWGPGGGE